MNKPLMYLLTGVNTLGALFNHGFGRNYCVFVLSVFSAFGVYLYERSES